MTSNKPRNSRVKNKLPLSREEVTDFLATLWEEGYTKSKMCELLAKEHGIHITESTVYTRIKKRVNEGKLQPRPVGWKPTISNQ